MKNVTQNLPVPDRLLVIACGMIAREVLTVKELNGLDNLELTCLPAELHYYPDRISPAMDAAIVEAEAGVAPRHPSDRAGHLAA